MAPLPVPTSATRAAGWPSGSPGAGAARQGGLRFNTPSATSTNSSVSGRGISTAGSTAKRSLRK